MNTKPKRKKHSASFKAKVGMEAMVGIKTVAQIAKEYGLHPVQVSQWKTVIRERLPELFDGGGKQGEDSQRLVADLHQKIGGVNRRSGLLEQKVQATGTLDQMRELVDPREKLSIRDQCDVLGISVSVTPSTSSCWSHKRHSIEAMTHMTSASDTGILKTDSRGRVRTPASRRDQLLQEFAQSGVSARRFAQLARIHYQTFTGWIKRQKTSMAPLAAAQGAKPPPNRVQWLEAVIEKGTTASTSSTATLVRERLQQ